MSFSDSIDKDHEMFDDPEEVTYTQGATTISVEFSQVSELTADEVYDSDGFFQFGDVQYMIGTRQLGALVPKIGDRIVKDAVAWRVLEAKKDGTGGSWLLPARKER